MTKTERNELKQIISERIKETKDEIDYLKELAKPVAPDNTIGRLFRMDAINNKTIYQTSLNENESRLKKLEKAQNNLNEEKFGKCPKCGDEIVFGPLKFMLWTTRCLKCA